MGALDKIIREVDVKQLDNAQQMWADILEMTKDSEPIPRDFCFHVMKVAARGILQKMEEAGFSEEVWQTYCEFLLESMTKIGSRDVNPYLLRWERVFSAVMAFPSKPQQPLKDYLDCAVRQKEQREKEMAKFIESNPRVHPSTVASLCLPDLEYKGTFCAVADAPPVDEVESVLKTMPRHMAFAHSNGILHLQLCDPLKIPPCGFVTTGYRCDTCHLNGLRAAYQAVIFTEEASTTGREGQVRVDAPIILAAATPQHGFDMCRACAVFFYMRHRERLRRFLLPPLKMFSSGRASGVRVQSAQYRVQYSPVPGPCPTPEQSSSLSSDELFPALPAGSPPVVTRTPTRTPTRTVVAPLTTTVKFGTSGVEKKCPSDKGSARSSSGKALPGSPRVEPHAPLTPWVLPTRAPSDAPAALSQRGSVYSTTSSGCQLARAPPNPPKSRCTVKATCYVSVVVTIAPFGARPIAWVRPPPSTAPQDKKRDAHSSIRSVLRQYGPKEDWRSRVSITAIRPTHLTDSQPTPEATTTKSPSPSQPSEASGRGAAMKAEVPRGRKALPHTGTTHVRPQSMPASTTRQGPHSSPLPPTVAVERPKSAASGRQPKASSGAGGAEPGPLAMVGSGVTGVTATTTGTNTTTTTGAGTTSNQGSLDSSWCNDTCAICLNDLGSEIPIVETKCHHWFHVECIEAWVLRGKDECPLCRVRQYMPDMSVEAALERNQYRIQLSLTEEEMAREVVHVCVGVLLTRNFDPTNLTVLTAGQCFTLSPKQLREFPYGPTPR